MAHAKERVKGFEELAVLARVRFARAAEEPRARDAEGLGHTARGGLDGEAELGREVEEVERVDGDALRNGDRPCDDERELPEGLFGELREEPITFALANLFVQLGALADQRDEPIPTADGRKIPKALADAVRRLEEDEGARVVEELAEPRLTL